MSRSLWNFQARSKKAYPRTLYGKIKRIFFKSGIVWLTVPRNQVFILKDGFVDCPRYDKKAPSHERERGITEISGRFCASRSCYIMLSRTDLASIFFTS
jgi:hypothetical protein